jgi:hypothetical protein
LAGRTNTGIQRHLLALESEAEIGDLPVARLENPRRFNDGQTAKSLQPYFRRTSPESNEGEFFPEDFHRVEMTSAACSGNHKR